MAFIDDIYVHITSEKINRKVDISEHPVEDGYSVADNIRAKPTTISLTGEIVPTASVGSMSRLNIIIAALEQKQKGGALVTYTGTTTLKNAVIDDFSTTASSKIAGGYAFTMTIREIKIAAPAYVSKGTTNKSTKLGTQQVQQNVVDKYHIVKAGDTLWSLAVGYYNAGSKFNLIYGANKRLIKTPGTQLQAGWRLHIP